MPHLLTALSFFIMKKGKFESFIYQIQFKLQYQALMNILSLQQQIIRIQMSSFHLYNYTNLNTSKQYIDYFNQDSNKELYGYQTQQRFLQKRYEQLNFIQKQQNQILNQRVRSCIQEQNDQKEMITTKKQQFQVITMRPSHRKIGYIQCGKETKQKRISCLKGTPSQTQNIGKHHKSITMAFFQILSDAKMLDSEQMISILAFKKKNGGIQDFVKIFRHDNLRKKCLEFFSSKDFVEMILDSRKMQFRNKIIMIKYLKNLRKIAIQHLSNWKSQQV